ncbi:MAG: OmpH family outer membrane protein [Bacteroidales bacterium]|jgi:Skp family chaperone for outer membrane proteins|nr:OmpH family outer membrane protein [Bacteroidales bacterium]
MMNEENNWIEEEKIEKQIPEPKPTCSKKCGICKIVFASLVVIAIVVLYVLVLTGKNDKTFAYTPLPEGTSASGEMLYINIDTVNANYKLVSILKDDIQAEITKQEALFAGQQKKLETKYAQFQKNYQANILTPVQVENTQQQLMTESQQLQAEYQNVMQGLTNRQDVALKQIVDSLVKTAHNVNKARNASFIFTYQTGGPLIVVDPTKDITKPVLDELNSHFVGKK